MQGSCTSSLTTEEIIILLYQTPPCLRGSSLPTLTTLGRVIFDLYRLFFFPPRMIRYCINLILKAGSYSELVWSESPKGVFEDTRAKRTSVNAEQFIRSTRDTGHHFVYFFPKRRWIRTKFGGKIGPGTRIKRLRFN